jgi:hypothetical protein
MSYLFVIQECQWFPCLLTAITLCLREPILFCPNFFTMLGPNSGVASGSLTKIIESAGDYIIKCIRKLQKDDIGAMHISPRAPSKEAALVGGIGSVSSAGGNSSTGRLRGAATGT